MKWEQIGQVRHSISSPLQYLQMTMLALSQVILLDVVPEHRRVLLRQFLLRQLVQQK